MKYKLPEGWKETKLGEVINLRRGHDLTKKNMNSQGIYSVIGSNGIIGDHDKYILEGPVVTVGRSGNVGKPFYHEKNAWPHNTTLYIDDLCVDENCRGQKVGENLFAYVKEEAKKMGCYNVTLHVWEGNDKARGFYDHMGMGIRKTQMEYIL